MYRPVMPVALVPREGDKRPVQGPSMISARMASAGLAEELVLVTHEVARGKKKVFITLWELAKKPKKRKKK
jgi:hypothetical protein